MFWETGNADGRWIVPIGMILVSKWGMAVHNVFTEYLHKFGFFLKETNRWASSIGLLIELV